MILSAGISDISFIANATTTLSWLGHLSLVCGNWTRKAFFLALTTSALLFILHPTLSLYIFLLLFLTLLILFLYYFSLFVAVSYFYIAPSYSHFVLFSTISCVPFLSLLSVLLCFFLLHSAFLSFSVSLLPSLSLSTKHPNGLSTKYTNGYNSPPHIQVHSFLLCIYITPYLILGEG